jgi:hypothetical protein
MDPLSLLIIAGSLGAKYFGNRDAERRSQQLQGAMQQYQTQKARQNEAVINQMVSKQGPQDRAKELADIQASRGASMQSTVDAARSASPVQTVAGTNTSKDYQEAQAAAATRIADKTKRAIQQLAVMGAPGEQGVASGIRFGRAAGNVDSNNAAIGNVGEGYMRDINNVRPNPMLSMLGDAGLAVGSSMAFSPRVAAGAQPNLVSPNNMDWGSLDAGPGAYSVRPRVNRALSLWGNG